MKLFLFVLTKLTLSREHTVGSQNQKKKKEKKKEKENKVKMFELTESCREDKNLLDLILQSSPLLSKNTEKYFPSLEGFSLDLLIAF
jgi:hypothetical protein